MRFLRYRVQIPKLPTGIAYFVRIKVIGSDGSVLVETPEIRARNEMISIRCEQGNCGVRIVVRSDLLRRVRFRRSLQLECSLFLLATGVYLRSRLSSGALLQTPTLIHTHIYTVVHFSLYGRLPSTIVLSALRKRVSF